MRLPSSPAALAAAKRAFTPSTMLGKNPEPELGPVIGAIEPTLISVSVTPWMLGQFLGVFTFLMFFTAGSICWAPTGPTPSPTATTLTAIAATATRMLRRAFIFPPCDAPTSRSSRWIRRAFCSPTD